MAIKSFSARIAELFYNERKNQNNNYFMVRAEVKILHGEKLLNL